MSNTHQPLAFYPPGYVINVSWITLSDFEDLKQQYNSEYENQLAFHLLFQSLCNNKKPYRKGVVCRDTHNRILGYGHLTLWSHFVEISDLFVESDYRSRGYGTAMIRFLVINAKQLYPDIEYVEIGAAVSNQKALKLYNYLGFRKTHTIAVDLKGIGKRELVNYMKIEYLDLI